MKYLINLLLLLVITYVASAQDTDYVDPNYRAEKQKAPGSGFSISDRTYYGGSFGLALGRPGYVLLEPIVGLKMTEKLSAGVGIGYRYGWGQYNYGGGSYKYNNYLGRIFSRYIIVPRIYAHVEYMVESYDKIFQFESQITPNKGRTIVPFLFVGGGYRSQVGNGSLIFQVLFNVLQNNPNSSEVYPSGYPYMTVGYLGGF